MHESRLRTLTVLTLSLILWGVLYVGFAEGFQLLNTMISHEETRLQTVHAIYNVFFLTLLAMMSISSGIIVYSSLYRSREVAFLLTTPSRVRRVVLHKFQEALIFSGWGLFLLGTPLLVAFGRENSSPWFYFLLLVPFLVSFIVIPVGLGTVACFLVVRHLPRLRLHAVIIASLVSIGSLVGIAIILMGSSSAIDLLTPEWFFDTLARLRYSEQRVLPSWWLSTGLLNAAYSSGDTTGAWRESVWFLAVLMSNALGMYLLVGWVGSRCFLPGYSGLAGITRRQTQAKLGRIDRLLGWLLLPLPRRMRPMLLKDMRVFRRDALQWSQVLIFLGLLTFYFVQTKRIYYGETLTRWVVMVGFLNVGVIGFMLATFTTRFIYPLISLEGRRIWVLATAPVDRDTVIWGKFLFGLVVAVVPCSLLTLLSDIMLRIAYHAPLILVVHQLTCFVLCCGLSAIAVGLGARFPNLRESSPARIATGFGGTLTLVLSALFIVSTVSVTAIPTYFWLRSDLGHKGLTELLTPRMAAAGWAYWPLFVGVAVTIVAGLSATVLPLRSGIRAFRRLEL